MTIGGSPCDVTSARAQTETTIGAHLWYVYVCATCPSLGAISLFATGDDRMPYPQHCENEGGAPPAVVQLAICSDYGASCSDYSYDARSPGTCTITDGPTQAQRSTPIALVARVQAGAPHYDVFLYSEAP
jgi:hypothetical protein